MNLSDLEVSGGFGNRKDSRLSRPGGLTFAAMALLLAVYGVAGLLGIQAHRDPLEMDTTAYLSGACQISETGGVLNHISNCLNGIYREATQHPLYLLLLSPFAKKDVRFFILAKHITFGVGFFLLAVFYFAAKNFFGTAVALVSAALLVSNATFLNLSTMVACETLFVPFFILFWYFASKGFEDRKGWPIAGVFLSLAFLTKSLAVLGLPVFVVSVGVVAFQRKINYWNRYFFGFFVLFLAISSPLLARNVKVYGTPFYSDSAAVMWLDHWREYYRTDIQDHPPTLASYLRSHTPAEIASTFFRGIFVRTPKMIVDGLKPFAFLENPLNLKKMQGFYERTVAWQGTWALGLVSLCLAGLWKDRRRPEAVLAAAASAVFLVFVAWYSKVFPGFPPVRLLYPVLFFVLIFASRAAVYFLERIFVRMRWGPVGPWIGGAVAIYATVFLISIGTRFDWSQMNLSRSYSFDRTCIAQLRWADEHLREGEHIMAGSVFKGSSFYFESRLKGDVVAWPQVSDWAELEEFARKKSIKYAMLDLSTVAYNMRVYKDYFQAGPKIGLKKTEDLPPPFYELEGESQMPLMYRIYEMDYSR